MLKVKKIYSSDVVNEPYPFEDEFISSHPKCYVNGRRGESLSAIVIHYAVARNLKWLVNYFAKDIYNKDKRTASTHYCVDVDGSTVMMTKFSDTAFTVGDGGRKNYLKGYSIDNLQGGWWVQPGSGELTNKVNEISVSFETCLYPQDKVTDKIYESISNRCKYIIRNTNDTRIWRIVGHEHMVPDRKIDPGPQWDWKRFYVQYMNVNENFFNEFLSYLDDTKHLTTVNSTKRYICLGKAKKIEEEMKGQSSSSVLSVDWINGKPNYM